MSAAQDEEEGARVVEILAPVAVDSTYSYLAPAAMRLSPGDSVTAPLGRREAYGVVWSVDGDSARRAEISRRSAPVSIGRRSRKSCASFIDWLARYTLTPRGMALRLATRAAEDAGARDAAHALSRDWRCRRND